MTDQTTAAPNHAPAAPDAASLAALLAGVQPPAPPAGAGAAPAAATPAATPPAAAAGQPIGITSEQLKARLDETRASAATAAAAATLKALGFDTVDAAQKAFKALTDHQRAQMTDAERVAAELKDARAQLAAEQTKSASVPRLLEMFKGSVAAQLAGLPEKVRAAIVGSTDDPEAQLGLIDVFTKSGLLGAANLAPEIGRAHV